MNVEAIRERYTATRTAVGDGVTIVAATKYVSLEDMAALTEAGVEVVGENRVQDMLAKHAVYGDAFRWHFIGRLQSNKAKAVDRVCELVHAVDSDSTARRLTIPWLLEVNVSGEESKGGVPPDTIGEWVAPYPGIAGLMTMPAPTAHPEDSRPVFRHLHALAQRGVFALGVDRPLYVSVHSAAARLAPEGAALVHAMRYLEPGETPERERLLAELEAFMDLTQPGWRAYERARQFLPAMTAMSALAKLASVLACFCPDRLSTVTVIPVGASPSRFEKR